MQASDVVSREATPLVAQDQHTLTVIKRPDLPSINQRGPHDLQRIHDPTSNHTSVPTAFSTIVQPVSSAPRR